ncbi:MAG: L-threonylcarbamoyladenylate synthase [bacterium]|nr:threonylcarbamoyl-AMP synthase [bacterium]MBU1918387.1 threonylcarbamoyl-AMP synthase [bacterium]
MSITIQKASELIVKGEIVAVPTDTVYGLAASINHPKAIEKIFALKKRPLNKPLVVQIANSAQGLSFIANLPKAFAQVQQFWPGPLTIVFQANTINVPNIIRAGGNTIALRISNHAELLQLITITGPLAIPSANISGSPAATTADDVYAAFGQNFPVLDCGPCQHGSESTIISLVNENWKILREGVITKEQLTAALAVKLL